MRRALMVVAVAAILWIGLKDWAYRTIYTQQTPVEASEPDYTSPESWAMRPAEQPAGGWESPWGVDLFVLPPVRRSPHPPGTVPPDHQRSSDETGAFLELLSGSFGDTPVYAPYLRHGSPVQRDDSDFAAMTEADAVSAFQSYLELDNRKRGLLLVAPASMKAPTERVLALFTEDPDVRQRFGGVVWLGSDGASLEGLECSDGLVGQCLIEVPMKSGVPVFQRLKPNLPLPRLKYRLVDPEAAAVSVSNRLTFLSDWLDENAPKPAEPFGGFDEMESVEVAPIRRPGDPVDED
ncbi:MAG: hypothetical protein AAFW65_00140 [Pseudomonadota bacterium]